MNEIIHENLENWSEETVTNLISLDYEEDQHLEYKERLEIQGDGKRDYKLKIEELITSFANAKGGFIIFGLTDKRGIKGIEIRENEEVNLKLNSIISNAIPKIIIESKTIKIKGKSLLIVKIIESADKPVQCSNGSFHIRINGETLPLPRDYLRDWFITKEIKKQRFERLNFEINSFKEATENENLDSSVDYPIFYKLNIENLENALSEYSGYLKDGHEIYLTSARESIAELKKWKSFFELEINIELTRGWGQKWTSLTDFLNKKQSEFLKTNRDIDSVIGRLNGHLNSLKKYF